MLLLPAPTAHFVFASTPELPKHETRRFMFWYQRGHHETHRHLLGSFDGNPMLDSKFYLKLQHVRALLNFKKVIWHETNFNLYEQQLTEARKLDRLQKRKRKLSACNRIYLEELTKINNSSDLFKADKIDELNQKLRLTLDKIDEVYGTEESGSTQYIKNIDSFGIKSPDYSEQEK